MCIFPKYITNRTLHYGLFQPLKIQVPCGKCEECKRSIRNDWFVRCYFEWKNNRQNSNFFYTLTYNNENLPHVCGVPCFSKRHIQLFMKRLRYRLFTKLGVKLKYMITCEYGEKTHRPHYHVNFYLDNYVNPYWFLRFVTDSWPYGFVKSGDNVGQINSPSGIQYVTKYITKSLESYETIYKKIAHRVYARYNNLFNYFGMRYGVQKSVLVLRHDGVFAFRGIGDYKLTNEEEDFARKFITKMRRCCAECMPFHLQSSRLGVKMMDEVVPSLDTIPVVNTSGSVVRYKIPRYIKRLLWYDCVEDENTHKRTKFVLNAAGIEYKIDSLSRQIAEQVDRYTLFFARPPRFGMDLIVALRSLNNHFETVHDLLHFIHNFDLDLEILSIYKYVFRGRINTLSEDSCINSISVKEHWQYYMRLCLDATSKFDFGQICKDTSLVRTLSWHMWNLTPFFQPYEQALRILDEIERHSSSCASFYREEKENLQSSLRDYLK